MRINKADHDKYDKHQYRIMNFVIYEFMKQSCTEPGMDKPNVHGMFA